MAEEKVREFYLPTRIIFGVGSLSTLGKEAKKLGEKALVIGGRKSFEAYFKPKVESLLEKEGIKLSFFYGWEGEPDTEIVEEGRRIGEKEKVDFIIAIGGGSVIDCGKAISGVIGKKGSVEEFLEGKELPPPPLPFIAIPTTAGTGSEVTNNAVLINKKKIYKKSLRAPFLNPKLAIVDPVLTLTLPPHITAYTGLDALAQLIEAYVSQGSNPITDSFCIKGLQFISRSLKKAFENGEDISHRYNMSLAALLSGMALTNAGLGAVHGLAHPIGVRWGIPHGLICGVLLPHVVRFNMEYCKKKYAELCQILTGIKDAYHLPIFLTQLLWDLGINDRLRNWGVKEKDLEWIAESSFSGSMLKNPRKPNKDELVKEILGPCL